jgi:hypothetical protein
MLTLFSTCKPFHGHNGIIQRNALKSWSLLHPDVEIILFGNDEGTSQACAEYGLLHEPHVEVNENGTKRLDYIFDRAQEVARHPTLCYVNCDIILLSDFRLALEQVRRAHREFLMVGRRWDIDITECIDFCDPDWADNVEQLAIAANCQKDYWWIDYFAFPRGLYRGKIPPLVIGRVFWDNWLVWRALTLGAPVTDASAVVRAIHQNHDYSYHPLGKQGVFNDEQSRRNFEYAGGWKHLRIIADATEVLTPSGTRPNRRRHWAALERSGREAWRFLRYSVWNPVWFSMLGVTRPIRHALGLRARGKT